MQSKEQWTTPHLTVYGPLEEITQQIKYKVFGKGDDVLVVNQAILANAS